MTVMKLRLALPFLLASSLAWGADTLATIVVHASPDEVKDEIAHRLIPKGWSVSYDSRYKLIFTKPTEGGAYVVSSMLLGNGSSDRPEDVLTFDLSPASDSIAVTLRETISVTFADGQTRDTPVKGKKVLKNQQEFLASLEPSIALRAARAASKADAQASSTPDTSILQAEMGIEFQDDDVPVLQSVTKDSPAGRSGLQKGDVILSVNGKAVAAASTAMKLLADYPAGSKVALTILRDHHSEDLSVTF